MNKEEMAKWLSQQITKDLRRDKTHKRKMPPEELRVFLRERSRGNGVHGGQTKPRSKNVRDWGD